MCTEDWILKYNIKKKIAKVILKKYDICFKNRVFFFKVIVDFKIEN